jgi:nascent polypeptide-associated complex subunit beta
VYMAVGDNPGSGFSIVMRPQFVVTGLGDFCIGQISVPSGVNVSDGTKASIQVVTNAHSAGGLYQVRFHFSGHVEPRQLIRPKSAPM